MCGIWFTTNVQDYWIQWSSKLSRRGPDSTCVYTDKSAVYVFHHLGIINPNSNYNQPFFYSNKEIVVLCNGEIYNYEELLELFPPEKKPTLASDCDIIGHLYLLFDRDFTQVIRSLNGEFAIILDDKSTGTVYACRDFMGVRPLYYGLQNEPKALYLSSELKGLPDRNSMISEHIIPREIYRFRDSQLVGTEPYWEFPQRGVKHILSEDKLYKLLYTSVALRLQSERPIGFLLSGGIDSSVIVSIASRILGPENIRCFTIGSENSPDIIAARKVAQFLNVRLDIIDFNYDKGFERLPEVIRAIETYDITTIRASTPQYLLAEWIQKNTDIKVILSGEGSDEIFSGYLYSKFAPSSEELWEDGVRLLSELYLFDCLRTDRTMASWGLEVRVPFLDKSLVEYILEIDPSYRMTTPDRIGKTILREMIHNLQLLPPEITWRPKDAFSDSVSSGVMSWRQSIIQKLHPEVEKYWYLDKFRKYYPFKLNIVSHYWLPNWIYTAGEPSATVIHDDHQKNIITDS